MKVADLTTGAARLREAKDALQRAWAETREHWNDASSRNIEENHLKPLMDEFAAAMPAIQKLADLLAQAERACGPDA